MEYPYLCEALPRPVVTGIGSLGTPNCVRVSLLLTTESKAPTNRPTASWRSHHCDATEHTSYFCNDLWQNLRIASTPLMLALLLLFGPVWTVL